MSSASSIYQLFKRDDGEAAPVRSGVIVMIAIACVLTGIGVIRVQRQHEVLRLGFLLARESDHAHELRETRRRLEVERATLTAPDRIRHLATQLGMTPVAPDKIRILDVPAHSATATRAMPASVPSAAGTLAVNASTGER
jgi:cell division protein FtsL